MLALANVHAQSEIPGLNADSLKEILSSSDNANDAQTKSDLNSYDSFSKNSFDNTVNQIKTLKPMTEEKFLESELRKKRIQLAAELCDLDPRACILIENYQNYKNQNQAEALEDLKLFGVDIFTGYPISLQSVDNETASDEYIIKIGDSFTILISGTIKIKTVAKVNNSGALILEQVGAISVAGLTYKEARKAITDFISLRQFGANAEVYLESVAPIQVFTVGAVNFPGGYKLNSMAKPINALISSGGFTQKASLRTIKLFRGDKLVKTIDLYDFLIDGVNQRSLSLVAGDVLVVDGLRNQVSISGEVNRPAIYEFLEGETFSDLLKFSLGYTEIANVDNVVVKRRLDSGQYTLIKILDPSKFFLKDGDEININSSVGEKINYVSIEGEVRNPGTYEFKENLRIRDVVNQYTDITDKTYMGLLILKRYIQNSNSYRIIKINLLDDLDFIIQPKDKLYIFSKDDINYLNSNAILRFFLKADDDIDITDENYERDKICLSGLKSFSDNSFFQSIGIRIKELRPQKEIVCPDTIYNNPDLLPILLVNSAVVIGSIKNPGLFPLHEKINSNYLLEIAGNPISDDLNDFIFEIGSTKSGINQYNSSELENINSVLFLNVKKKSSSSEIGFITLVGEFNYPGTYPIYGTTSLSEVYERAKGVNGKAFPLGAIFTRSSIKKNEEAALRRAQAELAEILSSAIASGVLQQNSSDVIELINLMKRIDQSKPTGRLVAELHPDLINPKNDIIVLDGDTIYMPARSNTITIMGDVLNPVTVPYSSNLNIDDYITLAGGYKSSADTSKTYAILPNGESLSFGQRSLFVRRDSLLPGSTIIVPKQARPLSGLSLIEVITPILANLSLTAASIAAINN
jgi:polysaccharide export outer membrane protein